VDASLANEAWVVMCLAGPAAETLFCGPVISGSDGNDIAMAREYLARQFGPLETGFEFERLRGAAERLVATDWARRCIPRIADVLIRRSRLSGEDIAALIDGQIIAANIAKLPELLRRKSTERSADRSAKASCPQHQSSARRQVICTRGVSNENLNDAASRHCAQWPGWGQGEMHFRVPSLYSVGHGATLPESHAHSHASDRR
jgi:hypothetical protein